MPMVEGWKKAEKCMENKIHKMISRWWPKSRFYTRFTSLAGNTAHFCKPLLKYSFYYIDKSNDSYVNSLELDVSFVYVSCHTLSFLAFYIMVSCCRFVTAARGNWIFVPNVKGMGDLNVARTFGQPGLSMFCEHNTAHAALFMGIK